MWSSLFESQVEARDLGKQDAKGEVGRRIKNLVALGVLDRTAQGRLEQFESSEERGVVLRFKGGKNPDGSNGPSFGTPQHAQATGVGAIPSLITLLSSDFPT